MAARRRRPVLQAVFSDGLTHVSLFVEPIDRARHTRPLLTQVGATHTLMQPHGDELVGHGDRRRAGADAQAVPPGP